MFPTPAIEELQAAGGDLWSWFTAAEIQGFRDFRAPAVLEARIRLVLALLIPLLTLLMGVHPRLQARIAPGWQRFREGVRPESVGGAAIRAMDRIWGGDGWLPGLAFAVTFWLFIVVVQIPMAVLEQMRELKAGLATSSWSLFVWDYVKGLAMGVFQEPLAWFSIVAVMRKLGQRWWLLLGVPASVAMLLSVFLAPYSALLFNEMKPLREGPHRVAVQRVLDQAGIATEGIWELDASTRSNRPNAYIAGRGPTRRIVIYDVMVRDFTAEEVAVAIAHEVGHLSEQRSWQPIASALALLPLLWLFDWMVRRAAKSGRLGFTEVGTLSVWPFFMMVTSAWGLATSPISGHRSREREVAADEYALRVTRDPASFTTLLVKLAKFNKSDPAPDSPWGEWFFHDHPVVSRRIAHALRFKKELEAGTAPAAERLDVEGG